MSLSSFSTSFDYMPLDSEVERHTFLGKNDKGKYVYTVESFLSDGTSNKLTFESKSFHKILMVALDSHLDYHDLTDLPEESPNDIAPKEFMAKMRKIFSEVYQN